jgi:hypothetical protein
MQPAPAAQLHELTNIIGGDATRPGIVGVAMGFAGIALFIMLLVGGFKYISAGGDPKAAEAAKKTLTYAIGGIVLISMSYLFIRIVADFTGVTNLVNFSINR